MAAAQSTQMWLTDRYREQAQLLQGIWYVLEVYTMLAPRAVSSSRNTERWQCASSSQ